MSEPGLVVDRPAAPTSLHGRGPVGTGPERAVGASARADQAGPYPGARAYQCLGQTTPTWTQGPNWFTIGADNQPANGRRRAQPTTGLVHNRRLAPRPALQARSRAGSPPAAAGGGGRGTCGRLRTAPRRFRIIKAQRPRPSQFRRQQARNLSGRGPANGPGPSGIRARNHVSTYRTGLTARDPQLHRTKPGSNNGRRSGPRARGQGSGKASPLGTATNDHGSQPAPGTSKRQPPRRAQTCRSRRSRLGGRCGSDAWNARRVKLKTQEDQVPRRRVLLGSPARLSARAARWPPPKGFGTVPRRLGGPKGRRRSGQYRQQEGASWRKLPSGGPQGRRNKAPSTFKAQA